MTWQEKEQKRLSIIEYGFYTMYGWLGQAVKNELHTDAESRLREAYEEYKRLVGEVKKISMEE